MSASPRTVALVLHWSRPDLTAASVEALARSRPLPSILVVDNGSASPPPAYPGRAAEQCSLLSLRRNAGFAGGMNAGVAWALTRGFEFLWLLNDDVRVTPGAHGKLIDAARREPALWTPCLDGGDGRQQHVGGSVSLDGSGLRLADAAAFDSLNDGIRWVTGTALFVPAALARRLGPLDDRFFAYWEDVDWSVRASRMGIPVAVERDAVVVHRPTEAAPARSAGRHFLTARNEFLFARKHVAPSAWDEALPRIAARQLRFAGWLERRGQLRLARAVVSGGLSGLRGRTGPPRHTWLPAPLARVLLSRSLEFASRLERLAVERASLPARPRWSSRVGLRGDSLQRPGL